MGNERSQAGRMFAALLSACALVACGGAGDEASGGAEPVEPAAVLHFPLTSGSVWLYQRTSESGGEQQMARVTSRIVGTKQVDGGNGSRIETVIEAGDAAGQDSSDERIYVPSATGIRVYEGSPDDLVSAAFNGAYVMRQPAEAGSSYLQYDVRADSGLDHDGDGINDQMAQRSQMLVVGYEDLSSPAGTFVNCLHQRQAVHQTLYGSGSVPRESDFIIDTWYAPGIGRVKSVTQGSGFSVTDELTGYRVGMLGNDNAAPLVTVVTPGAGLVALPNAGITLEFDEDLDPESFKPGSLTLFDPSGTGLASSADIRGKVAHLETSSTHFGPGTYTIRLAAGIADRLGNATTAPQEWSFLVGDTTLRLVSTVPTQNYSGAPVDTPIEFVFSEAPNPASLTTDSVTLEDDVAGLISVQWTLTGNRLTITPARLLRPDAQHIVRVRGLTDMAGLGVKLELSFRTREWFTQYRPLLYLWRVFPYAVAIGDINGDGNNDLLMTTRHPSSLWVYDRLREPFSIALSGECTPQSVAIGDLNGDGLADVVVSGEPCGIEVLYQTVDHQLRSSLSLGRSASRLVRLADIDGDGRLELLNSGTGSGVIEVWAQAADGTLALSRTVDTGLHAVNDFDTGDLSGNGRIDIVAVGQPGTGTGVALLSRQVDGSYVIASLTGGLAVGNGVALGDVNGDHLIDIVATTFTASEAALSIFHRTANGYAVASGIPVASGAYAVRVLDVDVDGRADIAFDQTGDTGSGSLYILLQQSDGTLAPSREIRTGHVFDVPQSMAFGDLNGDGLTDFLIGSSPLYQLAQPRGALSVGLPRHSAVRLSR